MIKEYNITFVTKTASAPISDVPCGDCFKCCSLSPNLTAEEFESGKYVYTFVNDGGNVPVIAIPNTVEGCIYLRNNKCTIYNDRPLSCRQFDCRKGHYAPLLSHAKEKFGETS